MGRWELRRNLPITTAGSSPLFWRKVNCRQNRLRKCYRALVTMWDCPRTQVLYIELVRPIGSLVLQSSFIIVAVREFV